MLLGGLVVSTLPPSTPLLHYDVLVHVRQAEAGRMAGLAIVLLGLGLVAHAWLSLCRQVAVTHPRDKNDGGASRGRRVAVGCSQSSQARRWVREAACQACSKSRSRSPARSSSR